MAGIRVRVEGARLRGQGATRHAAIDSWWCSILGHGGIRPAAFRVAVKGCLRVVDGGVHPDLGWRRLRLRWYQRGLGCALALRRIQLSS